MIKLQNERMSEMSKENKQMQKKKLKKHQNYLRIQQASPFILLSNSLLIGYQEEEY